LATETELFKRLHAVPITRYVDSTVVKSQRDTQNLRLWRDQRHDATRRHAEQQHANHSVRHASAVSNASATTKSRQSHARRSPRRTNVTKCCRGIAGADVHERTREPGEFTHPSVHDSNNAAAWRPRKQLSNRALRPPTATCITPSCPRVQATMRIE